MWNKILWKQSLDFFSPNGCGKHKILPQLPVDKKSLQQ